MYIFCGSGVKERILNVDLLALLVMKHFFYSAFFLVTMLSISSCAMDEGMKPVNLSVDNVVSKFGDSIFLSSRVPCIDAKNGSVYITDYRAGVYALDSKLNLNSKMSNIGRGFGEVNRPAKFFVDDNNVITLYNEGLQRYSYFEKDSFLMADNASVKRIWQSHVDFLLEMVLYISRFLEENFSFL